MAKLDRLTRDLEFIGWLQKMGIKFVCCDMPEATRETIGIFGVLARWEREQISKRTKEALAEKKRQGMKLGYHRREVRAGVKRYWREYKKNRKENPKPKLLPKWPREKPHQLSKAMQADQRVINTIKVLRGQYMTFEQVAEAMNDSRIPSRYGGKWHKTSVLRVANTKLSKKNIIFIMSLLSG